MNGGGERFSLCLTHRRWRAVQVVLIVLVLIGAAWPAHVPAQASDLPAAAPSPGQTPPAELLDEQGKLDLASGFRGSIDARGWRLASGPDEKPAFAPLAAEEGYHWSGVFRPPGVNGVVRALAVDGAGNVYVGGEFTSAGGVAANNIAKWDGSVWSTLGTGTDRGVGALAVDASGNLYAGGGFTTADGVPTNHIAKWDGASWSALGSGWCDEDSYVQALAIDGAGDVYAGGYCTIGASLVNHIAKWNGSAWSALGSVDDVYALAVDGAGNLYAGGKFTFAGGVPANYVAKWDGSAWSALGSGIGGTYWGVRALAVDGTGNVYAGGSFDTAGGLAAKNVARWNGSTWSALGSGTEGSIYALGVDSDGNLYAGGYFSTAGNVDARNIAKWNGSAWSALGSLIGGDSDSQVNALVLDSAGNLYAGGQFITAGGVWVNRIAKWDQSSWSACSDGFGLDGAVNALAMDATGNLYAGGNFITAGGVRANRIAEWDGSAWSALGSGMDPDYYPASTVDALAVDSAGNLYAGGEFDGAGGVDVNHIAKWNGSNWSALGSGIGGGLTHVHTLALDDAGNLYAGGQFGTAGGVAAFNVAKWNGSTWSALGSGTDYVVHALAADGAGNLYVGGEFDHAGGVAANSVAKWNGSSWSALGNGTNGIVYALAVDGAGNLYAGGRFDTAGGVTANQIARWNGSTWSAVGSGMGGGWTHVYALAVDGAGNLYAGGEFGTAGGVAANYVAKWDGSAWSALGSGTDYVVQALAADVASGLYVGGTFASAGDKPSANVGHWEPASDLTLSTTGPGSGRVTSNPPGIDCGVDCTETYGVGTVVTLTASADTSSNFMGWSGACTGTDPCVVTLDASKTVTATFSLKTYAGTLIKAGNGSGNVNISPPGIDCGAGCNEITSTFEHGTVVTHTATAGAFSTFTGWTGTCMGIGLCVVTMNAAKAVTATFTLQTFPLNVGKAGTGSGTVASNPPGIDCGATCSGTFTYGTVVTLTATSGGFSTFTGWSGACAGTEPCAVTMDANKAVTATFTLQTFPLTVSKAGIGSGMVASNPAGIVCGAACGADFTAGTVVTLTATPGSGASFSGWSGTCTATGSCAVIMDAAKAVTATFGVPGAVTPQASTMYYGQQLQVEGAIAAAAPLTVTRLVVFTGTVPAGIFLVGVEGSAPYAGEVSAGRLINRLLAEGCTGGGACSAVDCTVYAPNGTHTDFAVTSPVMTDHLYLPLVSRS